MISTKSGPDLIPISNRNESRTKNISKKSNYMKTKIVRVNSDIKKQREEQEQ